MGYYRYHEYRDIQSYNEGIVMNTCRICQSLCCIGKPTIMPSLTQFQLGDASYRVIPGDRTGHGGIFAFVFNIFYSLQCKETVSDRYQMGLTLIETEKSEVRCPLEEVWGQHFQF